MNGLNENVLTVSQVNGYLKLLIEQDDFLNQVAVRGELSNCKLHSSGHLYFTLKDGESELAAIMFRSAAAKLPFVPKSGMKVTVYGKISVYEKGGRYQLYAETMLEDGLGALWLEFERLKKKLEAEGLFDPGRKRPLPAYPSCVGIVTSPTGAAVWDMVNITGRRFPGVRILICPVLVQGASAPASMCRALAYLNVTKACDVIILGRGGGSAEDLWAFNDEGLVRAVAASEIPIVSAVGHETDFTLCDFAADQRAPTPSAAAELVLRDHRDVLQRFDGLSDRMDACMESRLQRYCSRLTEWEQRLKLCSPEGRLKEQRNRLERLTTGMDASMQNRLGSARQRLELAVNHLEAVNPLAVLARGYGVVQDSEGRVVSSVAALRVGEPVTIRLSDGRAVAEIRSKEKEQAKGLRKEH